VRVDSAPGKGSTFRIVLPISPPPDRSVETPAAPRAAEAKRA